MWENYVLAQRQLQITIAEEDYARAAQLRDQITELLDLLPPSKQILIALEAQLEVAATIDERAACVASLGRLGDPSALPVLAKHLRDEHLGDIVESAMWSTFLHPPDPEVHELMERGMEAMGQPDQWQRALGIFDDAIALAPNFAEAYNKRATTFYLLNMHAEAIVDCRRTLALNEWHFGAASGLGMCAAALGKYEDAIEAFTLAVRINPRLVHLVHHMEQLRSLMDSMVSDRDAD